MALQIEAHRAVIKWTIALFAALSLYGWFQDWQGNWYRKLIPAEIETAELVFIDGQDNFREGCGVAVFALTPRMLAQIEERGSPASPTTLASQGAAFWYRTPYAITGDGMGFDDSWMAGLGCANMPRDLSRTVHNALREPGSFVSKLHEAAVIVIPSAGLVALVYFG